QAIHGNEPLATAAKLIDAVKAEKLADPLDGAYALCMASAIFERAEDLPKAIAVAQEAVEYGDERDPYGFSPRPRLARLLSVAGEANEAMELLEELRYDATDDAYLMLQVVETLEDLGELDTAVEWLSDAIENLLTTDVPPVDGRDTASAYL